MNGLDENFNFVQRELKINNVAHIDSIREELPASLKA